MLELENFSLHIEDRELFRNVNFKLEDREKVILIGPNGSGKSSLLKSIIGLSKYKVEGKIKFNNEDITSLPIEERYKRGIFLFFQDTEDIGVRIGRLLNIMSNAKSIKEAINKIGINPSFVNREMDKTLSGGERKIAEMLQLIVSNPKLALIDEFDSGIDFSLLKSFTSIINEGNFSSIIVTHNYYTIELLKYSRIILLKDKSLVEINKEQLDRIAKEGYGSI